MVSADRYDIRLLGVGIVGNRVLLIEKQGQMQALNYLYQGKWLDIFDKRFIDELDKMIQLSKAYLKDHQIQT
jgi:hypothetical protein